MVSVSIKFPKETNLREKWEPFVRLDELGQFLAGDTDQSVSAQVEVRECVLGLLGEIADIIASTTPFTVDALKDALQRFIDEKSIKFRKISQPLRVALTGRTVSPELFGTMMIIGRDRVVARLRKWAK
jgi:glutamyl/glutaminyl-tRNA synthetase